MRVFFAAALLSASTVLASLPTRQGVELSKRLDIEHAVKLVNNATAAQVDACPGYNATNVVTTSHSLTADLVIAGPACNVYGPDLVAIKLQVTYEDETRIHVKITDKNETRYQVPESVLPRPNSKNIASGKAAIQFKYTARPFTFSIVRNTGEVLFATSPAHPLVFAPQYLRLKTNALPADANIYGLGEHTETFRLPNNNLTRTLWSRDAYGVPAGTNLYGNHPIYFEHRKEGTHGVFLVNSNGMDIKINQEAVNSTTNATSKVSTSIEYNVIGGILDLYFIAGPAPVDVARQYAQIVGTPIEVPFWSFGFHNCRYGYNNYVEVAEVIANYSAAGIPLETMWTDIDYMYKRWTFSNDPDYFTLDKVQTIVNRLHAKNQQYILMVDPAVAYQPNMNYGTYDRGAVDGVFLREANGSWHKGVVWPGVTVYPDWFHPNASSYWTGEFARFFHKDTGIDIDGVWIDMNDPASFCTYPCDDPDQQTLEQNLPPPRPNPPPGNVSVPAFRKRATSPESILNLIDPPYAINNAAPNGLSDRTAHTDVVQYNGMTQYDTHNLYGTMMSVETRNAMLARRPGLRTLVITRSTFAGAGAKVGKWLGDNLSDWPHYRNSIAGMLGMATIYQIPMVGSDVCGFGSNTTEILCARWAMLGAFNPFYRDHNELGALSQEFYRWPTVAVAAKNAIDIRYRLLDYIYTAFRQAHVDGTPVLNPLWFIYPQDVKTYPIDLQFFYGSSVLVSPVTDDNATNVNIYLPKDTFYDFQTYAPVHGLGQNVSLTNVSFTSIPLHIRGGAVLPLRASSANTTTELRTKSFELVVAPGTDGTASGSLYIDDGVSIVQKSGAVTSATLKFAKGELKVQGTFAHAKSSGTTSVTLVSFLNVNVAPKGVKVNGKSLAKGAYKYDAANKVVRAVTSIPLQSSFTVSLS